MIEAELAMTLPLRFEQQFIAFSLARVWTSRNDFSPGGPSLGRAAKAMTLHKRPRGTLNRIVQLLTRK
jgi:hypothetical protein